MYLLHTQVDMARLALVRKRREEAEKLKAEEAEEGAAAKAKIEKAAKAQAAAGPQKLNPLEVRISPSEMIHVQKHCGEDAIMQ